MPRRYKLGADGQPHRAFYGKLPEEFTREDTMRFMVETDLQLSGNVSADTLALLHAEGYRYQDGNLVPAGKENPMEKGTGGTPAAAPAPLKLDVCLRCTPSRKPLSETLPATLRNRVSRFTKSQWFGVSFPSFYGTLFTHKPTWNCTSFSRARAQRLSMTLPILSEQTAAISIRGGMLRRTRTGA